MKKRFIIASTILALLSTALCGCTDGEPAAPLLKASEPSEPASSVSITDEKSVPESSPESSVESSESEPQSASKYPVQNAVGYTMSMTGYLDGKPVGTRVETYDDHGSLIRVVSKYQNYSYVGDNSFYAYEYNNDGTVRVKYDGEYREEYEYENGLEIKHTTYDATGREVSSMEYTYDEHGNELSSTNTVLGSSQLLTFRYEYDENGFWTKLYIYEGDGAELQMIITRVLDENGKELSGTREQMYTLTTYEIKYDEEGREVERHSTKTRGERVEEETRTVTEYDDQGRISRTIEYSLDGGEQIASIKEFKYTA